MTMMFKKKTPKCDICGGNHYKSFCWHNPKRGKNLHKKYSKMYKTGKTPKRDKVLSAQTLDRKRLILDLDKYCSLIVRIQASDKNGVATCYTCGKRLPWKCMQNGHFKSRQFLGTRFDFDNMRCCCSECNMVKHGNIPVYKERLIKEIGEDRVNKLETKKTIKLSTPELEELLKEMKIKYKQIIEEKREFIII